MPERRTHARSRPGTGVDAFGNAVVDPTKNVLDLVEAANRRQDDLRGAEARHLEFVANLRAAHDKEMREAETGRVNAVRQIDVLARDTAAERALIAIQTLDKTTQSNAENLRSALTSTAAAIATQTAATVHGINERIAALEKSSYEGQGKQAVADPMLAELVVEMRSLSTARDKHEGISDGVKLLFGAAGFIATILAIAGGTLALLPKTPTVAPAAPQVIYVPSPPGTMLPTSPPQPIPR